MKWNPVSPSRVFETGGVRMRDCGRMALDADEQITFATESGAEYDVARKDWGFYATPSLNGRLLGFGLRAVLVANAQRRFYIFLVEKGHEEGFRSYLERHAISLVRWLDDDETLQALETDVAELACLCGATRWDRAHIYTSPPAGEISFAHTRGAYRRELFRCRGCGHFRSEHRMGDPSLYDGSYVDSTYGDAEGLKRAFERIIALPPEKSDNTGRVERLLAFARIHFSPGPRTILDVGSGLCVFLHGMKRAGWSCTALDPDVRAAAHARAVVGVSALQADWLTASVPGAYDVITFNKVLEHVRDPVSMLKRARSALLPGGFIYVELPDGEAAAREEGFGREEFFVEHHHVFSAAALSIMAERAGFRIHSIERLREPSGKYTLRGFLS